jgi:hypothetical protein
MEDGLIAGNPAFRLGRYYRAGDEVKLRIPAKVNTRIGPW